MTFRLTPVELVLAAGLLLVLVLQVLSLLRVGRTVRSFRRLSAAGDGNLDQVLGSLLDQVESLSQETRTLRQDHESLASTNRKALQRLGMVRFNAYADTGGDQSFALAMVDEDGNGTILNGLFHRSECRVYAKPVSRWRSSYALTDEEQEALRKAQAVG